MPLCVRAEVGHVCDAEVLRLFPGNVIVELDTGEEASLPWHKMDGPGDSAKLNEKSKLKVGSTIRVKVEQVNETSRAGRSNIQVRHLGSNPRKEEPRRTGVIHRCG